LVAIVAHHDSPSGANIEIVLSQVRNLRTKTIGELDIISIKPRDELRTGMAQARVQGTG
jgi:hypothetical protein